MSYQAEYNRSIQEPEGFWGDKAKNIKWFEQPKKVLSKDEKGNYRWFEGGKLNTSYLALDYHIEQGRGNQAAIYYDSPVTGVKQTITYNELRDRTAKFAGALASLGVGKGDRVVVYMPMVPEAVISMLACARLGAIHSVVFGGFASNELAVRIDDAKPKVIVSASGGMEGKRAIPYKPLLDKAIELAHHKPDHCVILKRPSIAEATFIAGRDHDFNEILEKSHALDPVFVDAWDPLYILYTSGTTGKPKALYATMADMRWRFATPWISFIKLDQAIYSGLLLMWAGLWVTVILYTHRL